MTINLIEMNFVSNMLLAHLVRFLFLKLGSLLKLCDIAQEAAFDLRRIWGSVQHAVNLLLVQHSYRAGKERDLKRVRVGADGKVFVAARTETCFLFISSWGKIHWNLSTGRIVIHPAITHPHTATRPLLNSWGIIVSFTTTKGQSSTVGEAVYKCAVCQHSRTLLYPWFVGHPRGLKIHDA